MTTYGPSFDRQLDGARLQRQHEAIRDFMLAHGGWRTLAEIHEALHFPEPSISAQLRHLRKRQFGSYQVEKRRRDGAGTWEYRVLPPRPPITASLFDQPMAKAAAP
jgi:hypothetical protein